jgi:hypothetical protein
MPTSASMLGGDSEAKCGDVRQTRQPSAVDPENAVDVFSIARSIGQRPQ